MLLSIAFYSAAALLSVGIVDSVRKVVRLDKQIKALDESSAEIDKLIIKP